jgi:GT2 family glycosyltransferase
VGVKLNYPNDTIQHAGTVIGLGGVAGHTFIGIDRKDDGYYYALKCINNYSAVTAAALMVSKNKFDEVEGFRVELAVEYNDVDFCLKLLEAGYRNVWLPHVELYHYESLTRGHPHATEESYAQHIHDVGFFKQHWQKYIDNDPYYNPNLTLDNTHFTIRA